MLVLKRHYEQRVLRSLNPSARGTKYGGSILIEGF